MKGFKGQLAVGIVCTVLGLVLALQFRSVQGNLEGIAPTQKAAELASELTKIREEKEQLLGEITSLEDKIKEIEESESKEDVLLKNISDELERYKMISGFKSVKGSGVVVVVDDPPKDPEAFYDESMIMYNYDLLLSVVNKLNEAGAEAVSINEQRIISKTEISLAGSNVNINSVPTAPPFIIKAIGDKETLEATLNIRFGIVYTMREQFNLQVSVKKEDEIEIPRYNGIITFRYAKPVDEKE